MPDERKFRQLVEKAYEDIPEVFKEKMENIEIMIEDFPSSEDLRALGMKNRTSLLGLYTGTPLPHRSIWQGVRLPDTIVLFRKNIERVCRNDEELEERVREVLIHEIAHYFGLSDEEIYKLMDLDET